MGCDPKIQECWNRENETGKVEARDGCALDQAATRSTPAASHGTVSLKASRLDPCPAIPPGLLTPPHLLSAQLTIRGISPNFRKKALGWGPLTIGSPGPS